MSFKIGEAIKKLPDKKTPAKAKVYSQVIEAVEARPKGYYPITIEGKKTMTCYVALSKRLASRKDLKLHLRGKALFIEKV